MKIAKNKRWAVCTVTLASSTPFSGSYRIIPAREIVTEQSDICTIFHMAEPLPFLSRLKASPAGNQPSVT